MIQVINKSLYDTVNNYYYYYYYYYYSTAAEGFPLSAALVHSKVHKETELLFNQLRHILGFHPRDFRLDDGCYPPCWCPNKRVRK